MPAILQQLRTRVDGFPATLTDSSHKTWTFDDQIKNKENSFFSSLVITNPLLFTQYRIQCSHVVHLCCEDTQNIQAILQSVETALVIADLLEQIYCRLDERSNIEQLNIEQEIFRTFLSRRYSQFETPVATGDSPISFDQTIRSFTSRTNLSRQTVSRIRYMMRSIVLIDELVFLREWVEPFELMINPVLLHLNWIFFVPRLVINMMLLTKHVMLNPWMSESERLLTWDIRLHVHLIINQRWVELVNDFVWCAGNLISCFLCIGALSYIEVYFAVGLQLFDLLFTCLYVAIEINRLNLLEEEYQAGCTNGTIFIDTEYLHALQDRISLEKNKGYLAIINHSLLLLSILTILPAITALSPFAPLVGAVLSIITTITVSLVEKHIKTQYADDDITSLSVDRFFRSASEQEMVSSVMLCNNAPRIVSI